jgi:hypothetical protein
MSAKLHEEARGTFPGPLFCSLYRALHQDRNVTINQTISVTIPPSAIIPAT